jgi:hypothetical protein
MPLSEALSSYLAHRALEAIRGAGATVSNERLALGEVKKTLARLLDRDPAAHQAAVRRIASLSRRVPEGSAEYEILYRQHYEQELRKKRGG